MFTRKVKLFIGSSVAIIVMGAAVAGVLGAGAVMAQTPPAGGQAPNTAATPQADQQNFLSKLAAKLGTTGDKLKGAIKDASTEMVDEAQQQGKITKDQADKLHQRIQDAPNGFGFFGLGGPRMQVNGARPPSAKMPGGIGGGTGRGQLVTDTAQLLGMTAADVQTQLQSGKSLADVAGSKGISRQQLIDGLVKAETDRIQQRVKDGKLTDAQAKQLTDRLTDMIGRIVDAKHTGEGFLGHRGPLGGQGQQAPAR